VASVRSFHDVVFAIHPDDHEAEPGRVASLTKPQQPVSNVAGCSRLQRILKVAYSACQPLLYHPPRALTVDHAPPPYPALLPSCGDARLRPAGG